MPVAANTMRTQAGGGKAKQDAVRQWLTSVPEAGCEEDNNDQHQEQTSPSDQPVITVNRLSHDDTSDNFVLGAEAKMMCGDTLTLENEVSAPPVGKSRRHSSISALTPKHLKLLQAFANNASESFNSDVSTTTSVEQLLRERQGDPEQILTNLGFAASGDAAALQRVRLPVRFLVTPSSAHGISVSRFLDTQPHVRAFWEEAGEVLCGSRGADDDVTFTSVSEMLQHMQKLAGGSISGFPAAVAAAVVTKAPPGKLRGKRWHSTMKLLKHRGLLKPSLPTTPEVNPPASRRRRMGMSVSMPHGLPQWERVEHVERAERARTLDSRQTSVVAGHELPERFVMRQCTETTDHNSNLLSYKPNDDNSADFSEPAMTGQEDETQSIASASSIPKRFLSTSSTLSLPADDLHTCYSDTQLANQSGHMTALRRPFMRGLTEESDLTDDSGPLRRFSSVSDSDAPWRRESDINSPLWQESDKTWYRGSGVDDFFWRRESDNCVPWQNDSVDTVKMVGDGTAPAQQNVSAATWRPEIDFSDPSQMESNIAIPLPVESNPLSAATYEADSKLHTVNTVPESEITTTDTPHSQTAEPHTDAADNTPCCTTDEGEEVTKVNADDGEDAKPPPSHFLRWRNSVHFRRTIEPAPTENTSVPWRQLMKSDVAEQASFELEEIQSTDFIHEDSPPGANGHVDSKGVLLRTGSAQSDSSGFAESADSSQTASDVVKTHWSSGDSESTLADLCGSQRRLSDDSQVTSVTVVPVEVRRDDYEETTPFASQEHMYTSCVVTEIHADSYLDLSAALCGKQEPCESTLASSMHRDRCQSLSDELHAAEERDVVKSDAAAICRNRTSLVVETENKGNKAVKMESGEDVQETRKHDNVKISCRHHKMLCCLLRQTPSMEQDLVESVGPAPYLHWPVVTQVDTDQLMKELRLIQYSLHKYEVGLTVLESRTRSSYEHTSFDDPLLSDEMDELRQLKSAIWRELQELSDQLAQRLKKLTVCSAEHEENDVKDQQCLCTVKQMVELLKEQLHHSYIVSLLNEDSPLAVTRRTNVLHSACSQNSVCESVDSYRCMLDSSLSELKSSVLSEIRSNICQQMEPLTLQMKAAETKLLTLKGHVDNLCLHSRKSELSDGDGDFRDGKK